jgi:hypothetical protein
LREYLMLSLSSLSGVVLALVAFQDPAPSSTATTSKFYPLAAENTWEYKTTTTGEGKDAATGTFTMNVAKEEEVGGVKCWRVEMIIADKVVAYEHVRVTEDGIYRHSFSGTQPTKPVRFFKLPPKVGDEWTVETEALGETLKGKFVMGEEEVKVGEKTYKAFKSTSTNEDASGLKFTTTYYFAEDVGMVKQVLKVGTQETVIELEKYTLK